MINFNGTILEKQQATISVSNRGLNYGDAIFETLRVSAGKIYFWEDHYFRLMASMRILRMEIPMNFTQEYLEKQVLATIEANGSITAAYRVKILVWRQQGGLVSQLDPPHVSRHVHPGGVRLPPLASGRRSQDCAQAHEHPQEHGQDSPGAALRGQGAPCMRWSQIKLQA